MKCNCDSNLEATPIFDGHHIYLCSVCPKCEKEKLSKFRADIFERYECDEPIESDD